MNAIVRPAIPRDIDAICTLLHTRMNTRIPLARWYRLMNYEWLTDKPDFGQVVDDGGDILGYCGMVYSDRVIGSASARRPECMVSMSSWYLDKSLRGQGLGKKMLDECTVNPMLSYATLTNSAKPLAIVQSCGFEVLEDHRYLWRKAGKPDPALHILDSSHAIAERLGPVERKLLDDMSSQPLDALLLSVDNRQALVFFSVKRKDRDILWFDLMYASDLALFAEHAQSLANSLLPDDTAVLAADGRFVGDAAGNAARNAARNAERVPLPVPRFFKSQRVAAHEFDHLYSELQLLDLKLD